MVTLEAVYTVDTSKIYPIKFFVQGIPYSVLGLFETGLRLFGVEEPGVIFLFGTDNLGRDLFSRVFHGGRLSLSIGLVGVSLSFIIGLTMGGISGYYGGALDTIIQRAIEFLISIPTIPLWIALGAALPKDWSVVQVYFGIVVILSLVGWGGLARVVRGKFLELRELDFVLAARTSGLTEWSIIRIHLIPNFASYLIVDLSLAIPSMILGETALSFLGLGLRSPAVSWGVLLEKAQNIASVAIYWWTLVPAIFVVVTVMAFNFLGDGLRDAADPYKQ
jgi:peptide/nickel transport system permease protein